MSQLATCPVCQREFVFLKDRREKYCSRDCAHKRPHENDAKPIRRSQDSGSERNFFPAESGFVELIVPGLSRKHKEPLVWFLVRLKDLGYEIVKNRTEKESNVRNNNSESNSPDSRSTT